MKIAELSFQDTPFKRCYVVDHAEMAKCAAKLLESRSKHFGLDIETAKKRGYESYIPFMRGKRIIGPAPGLCPHLSEIRLIQIYDPAAERVYVFDCFKINDWKGSSILRTLLEERKYFAHNGIFEIKQFTKNGFPFMHVDCSMLTSIMVDRAERSPFEAKVIDEDEEDDRIAIDRKTPYTLDAVTHRLFKIDISKELQRSDWNQNDLSRSQLNYAATDAILTYKIGAIQAKKVSDYEMLKSYRVLRDMQHVVAEMEINGFAIDSKAHNKLIEKWKVIHNDASNECRSRFGREINLRSPVQLNKWAKGKYPQEFWQSDLWPKTAKSKEENVKLSFGKGSLAEVIDTIERRYKKTSKALEALLRYKTVDKLISTYGDTLEKVIHPLTGRLHSSFILGETRTNRLSSRQPNLQNAPRDEDFRRVFTSPPGRHLLIADYSQIEIRAQAALSLDPVMTDAFANGVDLHEHILRIAFGWGPKYLSKLSDIERKLKRQLGKAINFGFAFGMSWKKFAKYALVSYGVKVTDSEAKKVFKAYHMLYKGYSSWCDRQRKSWERLGFVRTPLGKMRKLNEKEFYTRSVNTPVQGGAAEVMMKGLVIFQKRKPKDLLITNNVHDEVITECGERKPFYKELLEECMTEGFQFVFPDAPTYQLCGKHGATFGKNWVEAKG